MTANLPYRYTRGHQTDELIALTGFETMPKQARWQLIDIIERRIDLFQKWQKIAIPGGEAHTLIVAQLKGLRLKRFQIWNSFYPRFAGIITPAQSYQPLPHR